MQYWKKSNEIFFMSMKHSSLTQLASKNQKKKKQNRWIMTSEKTSITMNWMWGNWSWRIWIRKCSAAENNSKNENSFSANIEWKWKTVFHHHQMKTAKKLYDVFLELAMKTADEKCGKMFAWEDIYHVLIFFLSFVSCIRSIAWHVLRLVQPALSLCVFDARRFFYISFAY